MSGPRRPILRRYRGWSPFRWAYRALRLARGGFREIAARLPGSGLVVDVGCGEGLLTHVLLRDGPGRRVLAVDHDEGRIARLRGSAADLPVTALVADMRSFLVPTCEGVAVIDVLHYLGGASQEALLHRIHEALRPGGVLVVRDPDRGALRFWPTAVHEFLATGLGFTSARIGRYRRADEWVACLRSAGFASVEVLPLRAWSPYADRTLVARKGGAA